MTPRLNAGRLAILSAMPGPQATDESATAPQTPSAPIFRRPAPEDALDLAYRTFLSGERVEMGALAAELNISAPTLYRWVGTREQLLDAVLGRIADELGADAVAAAQGRGDGLVLDLVRKTMAGAAGFTPGRSFVQREPQLALRLALGRSGAVHRSLTRMLRAAIEQTRTADQARALDGQIDLMIEVCTGLQWTAVAIGDEPQVEGAVDVVRALLRCADGS